MGTFWGGRSSRCATSGLRIKELVALSRDSDCTAKGNALKLQGYAIHIEPLPREEGSGFLVTVPDLPGCVADGETVDAAIAEAHDAFKAWAAAEQQDKGALPPPKTYGGQFVQLPKSLHQRLATRAAAEGVSLNQLAATYLAQGLAERSDGQ